MQSEVSSARASDDLDLQNFKRAMKKIESFQYQWAAEDNNPKRPNGLEADSKYSLADVLGEAKMSERLTQQDMDMLNGILPCCRKDRGKRDYIEALQNQLA